MGRGGVDGEWTGHAPHCHLPDCRSNAGRRSTAAAGDCLRRAGLEWRYSSRTTAVRRDPCGPARNRMDLKQLLGTELPIIQAPMAGVQVSALAIAVSNAGGLGSLPCAMLGPDAMRKELAAIKAATGKPYNVNFFCHTPPAPSAEREAAWRTALAPYYQRVRHRRGDHPAGPGRTPFSAEAADVLEEFKPRGGELSFRPAVARAAGARARPGARRSCPRPPPSTRRAGSKRAASTPSSRRASRPAGTAASSCPRT